MARGGQDHIAGVGLEVHPAAQPGRRDLAAGVQEPAVLAAVAAARDADPGRRQRPVLALKLGQPPQAAVARVNVEHQEAGGHPGTDVGLRPPAPPGRHPGRVAAGRVQAMAQLVPAVAGQVRPVIGRTWVAGRAVPVGQLAAQREHLVASRRVGQRRLPQPSHGLTTAAGFSRRA
jgi:hypothetical protein